MAAADDLTQTFQLTSPVTELAEHPSEVHAQCSENEEQDESSKESQLFDPAGEEHKKQASGICEKFRAVSWKKVFTLVVVIFDFFLVSASLSLIAAFFTTKAKEKEASALEIGIIVGITPFTLTVFSPCIGYLLPKLGFRFSLGVGLTIVGVTNLTIGPTIYLPSGWPFILVCFTLRFIAGIGCSLYYTTAYTIATETFPDSVGFAVGLIELGAGLGYACGPAVGGYLYLAGGYLTPFIVVGGLCLICLIPSMLIISTIEKKSQLISLKVVAKLLNSFTFFLLMLSIVVQMGALGFINATIAIFLNEEFSLTPEKIGLIFLAVSICYIITGPISGKIADKTNPRILVISGLFTAAVGYFFLGPSSILSLKPILWLTIVALGIIAIGAACGMMAAFPDVTAVALSLMESEPEDDKNSIPAGIIGALITFSISFGEFIGPVTGGLFTQFMSFQESTSVSGELILALMFTIVGVTLIDKLHKLFKIQKKKV